MAVTYSIIEFKEYIIIDKILYRISYKTKSELCKWQYRKQRKINRSTKDNKQGYWLVKHKKRKFYSLEKLRHRLKIKLINI